MVIMPIMGPFMVSKFRCQCPWPATPGVPAESQPSGGGIRFRRLRFRTGGNPEAPQWLLDGVTIFLRIASFELSGFGTATDQTRDGHRYREFGLGLFIAFHAMGKDFSIGAQLDSLYRPNQDRWDLTGTLTLGWETF